MLVKLQVTINIILEALFQQFTSFVRTSLFFVSCKQQRICYQRGVTMRERIRLYKKNKLFCNLTVLQYV